MPIVSTAALTSEQTAAMKRLHAACLAHDGAVHRLELDTGMNVDPQMDAFYLAYEGEELAGFVTVYHSDDVEAEIAGFTAPQYRRRGVFRALLAAATAQLRDRGVKRLLLQCNPAAAAGPAAMEAMGLRAAFSEYAMARQLVDLGAVDARMQITIARPEELEDLCALAGAVFGCDPADYRAFFERALGAPDMTVYTARVAGETVGLCRIIWSEQPPYLCTFGIRPELRGRGLGAMLMGHMLQCIAGRGCDAVKLDVDCGNAPALALYHKLGFQVKTQIHYYEWML